MSKQDSLCRICIKESTTLISILEDNALNLQDKMLKLLRIKVSESSLLPKQICLECITKLTKFNEFFVQSHENQVILQVLFNEKSEILNDSIKNPVEFKDSSTQTEEDDKTQQSETYLIIEEFNEDGNTDETSQDYKMEEIGDHLEKLDESTKSDNYSKSKRKFDRFDCYICNNQLAGNFQFLKHFSTDHPKEELKYQCYICKGFVKKYRSYTRHIESHTEKRFECDICNLKFSQKITLVTHLSSHSQLKKFDCKDCNLSFKQNSSLFKHRKQKHSNNVPTCQECNNRTFVNKETYQQHLKSKHNQQMKDINCDECNKKFASKAALSYHRLSNHPRDKIELKCETCLDEFKNKIILARHKKKCFKNI